MEKKLDTSPRLNQVLSLAEQIAREYGSGHIGTEHVFIALIDSPSPTLSEMLEESTPSPEAFKKTCFEFLSKTCDKSHPQTNYADIDFKEAAKMLENLAAILKHIKR